MDNQKKRWSMRLAAMQSVQQKTNYEENTDEETTPYKKQLKKMQDLGGDKMVKEFKRNEALRSHLYRMSMSDEQRRQYNEKARIRQIRYRNHLKEKGLTRRPRTRVENDRLREYNRMKKRESRSRKSDQQRQQEAWENRHRLLSPGPAPEPSTSQLAAADNKDSSSSDEDDMQSTNTIYLNIQKMLQKLTPNKKKELAEKGICTLNSAKHISVKTAVVDEMVQESETLKKKKG